MQTETIGEPMLDGSVDARFERVRDEFARQLASGEELGASLAVDVDGRSVVDLWGGYRDTKRSAPWQPDTIANMWSTTKTLTALAALVLVDRGLLDPFAPVARYWPEFAENGKEAVQVRHVLSHSSGVSGWEAPFAVEELFDQPRAAARLAGQSPWWPPGTASGYHVASYGTLVGELVGRITGRTLGEFIADEIAGPLGADVQLGARPSDRARVAPVVPPPPPDGDLSSLPPDSVVLKTFSTSALDPLLANTTAWQDAQLGALNGHGNARAITTALHPLARDGIGGGSRLLSHDTVELVFQEQTHGPDLVLGLPLRWGIGMALAEPAAVPYVHGDRTAFWMGWGGSAVISDPDRRLTIGYVMNRMSPSFIGSDRLQAYVEAIEACLAAG